MSDLQAYNPYGFENAPFEVRDLLSGKILEAYDDCFELIGKYDTERDWEDYVQVRPVHKRVRIRIWQELTRLFRYNKKKFVISRVLQHELDPRNFYRMIKNPELCAYLFTKPIDHHLEARVMLDDSIDNLRNILRLSQVDPKTGAVRASVLNAQMKAFQMLQDRVLGQTVQRIQQQTVTKNIKDKPKTIESIDAELRALEQKEGGEHLELPEVEVLDVSQSCPSEES